MFFHSSALARQAVALALAVGLIAATPGPASADGRTPPTVSGGIGFGLMSVQNARLIEDLWRPVLDAIERRVGAEVRAEVSKDYAGIIWAMRAGRNHVAWLGNKSAIEAVENADGEVFLKTLYASGESGYRSLLVVPVDSPHTTAEAVLANAAGLTLGTGDTNSTSGYLVPGAFLFGPARITPRAAFKRVVQANHEDNLLAVAEGRVDAATIASLVHDRVARFQPEIVRRVRVVWRSPLIPADPIVWRRDLPDDVKRRILDAFLDFGTPRPDKPADELAREREAMDRLGFSRFERSDDRQLIPVRRIELYRGRLSTEENAALGADERDRRLAEIDRQIATLAAAQPSE